MQGSNSEAELCPLHACPAAVFQAPPSLPIRLNPYLPVLCPLYPFSSSLPSRPLSPSPGHQCNLERTERMASEMSRANNYCCDCVASHSRCSADSCPCVAARKTCDEHCESTRYRGDCLNQAICKCSCEVDPAKPAKNACSKNERCDCLRIKEGCSKLCACKQICKNKEPPKKLTKVAKPSQGCQCAKSKKQCVKKECPCRTVYEFCSPGCKCSGDCTNGASKFSVPKHVQNCFLEHKHESSGLIVTLIGDDYIFRCDFYHESKGEPHVEEQLVAAIYDMISKYNVDLYEILIFVSKSPCFHQDCDPKCEVVDECKSNKACAKLLGLLLSKVRKEIKKVDVKMTVKFLYPHLNRGDLYTKQGILSMLQAGIKVEPLLMKDWCSIMDWSPNIDHKGDYLQSWTSHHLDKLDLTATPHKIRSTPSKRRSFIDLLELRDKLLRGTHDKRNGGSSTSVASEDAQAQAMVASFCGRSFDDCETDEIAQRIRRATANINLEIETLLEFLTHKGAIS
ncbi:hypothetical protein WR25_01549 [Diploscapter pachys]|uniref:CRC domain-containing protein n=1 Tax=Diploscapter pachys TaxID=2018661 RepID=A0A2A2K5D0_9BILA|nr:hypothetical protein WR25_01549 [Diploscapter pachys]